MQLEHTTLLENLQEFGGDNLVSQLAGALVKGEELWPVLAGVTWSEGPALSGGGGVPLLGGSFM